MAETLRDLVVSLSLQTDNFTRNIKSVNKQIAEAESQFKLAASGVEGFERSATGLATQLSTLERRLSLQKDAVTQYERALSAANDKLQECFSRQNDYAQRLTDAKTAQQALKEQVAAAAQQVRTYSTTLGENDSATIAAKANLDALKAEYRNSCAEVKKLTGQNTALKKTTQNAADAVTDATTKLNTAQAAVRSTQAEINRCNQSLRLAQTNWDAAGKSIDASKAAIVTFGKQIGLAESRFKLATAGIKDMDTSVTGLAAKLTLLNDKLRLQEQSVQQYENALRGAKEQLTAAQQANDPEKVRQASDAVIDAEAALNRAKAAVAATRAEIEKTNQQLNTAKSAWTEAGKNLEAFGKKCDAVSKKMTAAGRTLTAVMTTPILGLGATAVKASIGFESSFASVRKTVDATEAEFDQLAATSKHMSTEVAAGTNEINEVMAAGGQLGVATEHLSDFTRVMIDLGNSCEDLSADEAATTIAQFANIMGTSQSQFSNIGSTLVDLGNNFATTEKPIMEMAHRMAGAGKQVGLTEAQVLGFAAALSSVGIEAQMGGSAFSKALVKMEVASATGGEALDDFGKVAGMTAQQFKTLWDNDPAAAFQAFIVGLSKLDDEGESAIKTLSDIGINEIRLRDTLLRATNATELFSRAQNMANAAWEENTALTNEAGKRYSTTASKLTNLKNKALLFGQQIGDDLNPTIQSLIEGADNLLSKFLQMDEAQRKQIIQYAAIAAAIGPVLLLFDKVTKGIGSISTGVGKFATAVGKAGGGIKGFLSVLGSSPAVWLAVAAATIYATVAIADYVSGAKQAREALKGMQETADKWKSTAAETFYGNSEGLSFFGMSKENFIKDKQSAQEWLDGLLAVWTDGEKESNEIVAHWTDSFKSLTDSTRTELQALKDTADKSGYTSVSKGLAADIQTLDQMDAEIARLLKKRQNGFFSEKDQIRLQELIDTRETIEVKYHLTPEETGGFETIAQKVEAEVARAQARGKTDADTPVYENAVKAAAEGMAAINAQIDERYDKEYGLIQLIEDETERQKALEDLNSRYNEERKAAAQEYAETLSSIVMPVWNQPEIQQASHQVDELFTKLREYSMASESEKPALLADLQALSSSMDEGALAEYLSLMTQIQSLLDSGMSESEVQALFPDIDFSTQLDQFAGIVSYLDLIKTDLPGLYSMFGEALPEEVLKIATDLDMTGAQARWDEFAANPGAITTEAIITGLSTGDQQVNVDAFISSYTEIPEGASTAALTPKGLVAYVEKYAEVTGGADVSGLTPEIAECLVAGYKELASGADVSLLKPDEIVAYVSSYAQQQGVDISALSPEGLTAFVMAYEEATGGALTTALTPDDVTAMVAKYLQAENVDLSALTPDQIEAIVSRHAEATGCDKSQLLPSFTAYITEYKEAEGVSVPKPKTQVIITGYDYLAYRQLQNNPDLTLELPVRLGELPDGELDKLMTDGKVKFWKDGVEVPIEAVPDGTVDASTVASLDQDGTLHILITPEITGTKEAIDALSPVVDETDKLGVTMAGMWAGIRPATTMDKIDSALGRIRSYQETLDYNAWDKFWASVFGASTNLGALDQSMKSDFNPEIVAEMSSYVAEVVSAIHQGVQVPEEDLNNLQSILDFLNGLDMTGTGAHIREGIAQGMTEAGFDSDAETVATNLETALNTALDIHSPSQRVKPVGEYVSAGVGEGMGGYDFTSDAGALAASVEAALTSALPGDVLSSFGTSAVEGLASALSSYSMSSAGASVASGVRTAVSTNLTATTLRSAGVNAMAGLRAGILAGRSGVISAMRSAAREAVNAAKKELKIKSPSQVFRDEVGVMTMRGFGAGVLKESKEQAKVIRNASRFLTGEAREGSIVTNSSDNRKTYNNNVSSTIQVQQMVVRDEQDIRSLAVEIATLTRRQQRGKGLRMA
nr:MAG TPA: minor tail protein [Caudoviricetes sp.]